MENGVCKRCGADLYPDNERGGLRCRRCGWKPPLEKEPPMQYSMEKLLYMGVECFFSGNMRKAGKSFNKILEQDPEDWTALFYHAWIDFTLAHGADPEGVLRARKDLASVRESVPDKAYLVEFVGERGGEFLDMLTELYGRPGVVTHMEHILMPYGIDILCFFSFLHLATQETNWRPDETFVKRLDRWIDALTMKLLVQVEFTSTRLKLPVELLSRRDILDANRLFGWLDALCDAIMQISDRCGVRFFELQIAVRLEIAQQCMPRIPDVCKTYTFRYPSEQYNACADAGIAQAYAFMVFTICHSVLEYNKSLRQLFVENVPMLHKLEVRQMSPGAEEPEGPVYYQIPPAQIKKFEKQAETLQNELLAESGDDGKNP